MVRQCLFLQAFTGDATGALTYSLVKTLEQEPKLTYGRLLVALHNRIGAAQEKLGLSSNESHSSQVCFNRFFILHQAAQPYNFTVFH